MAHITELAFSGDRRITATGWGLWARGGDRCVFATSHASGGHGGNGLSPHGFRNRRVSGEKHARNRKNGAINVNPAHAFPKPFSHMEPAP